MSYHRKTRNYEWVIHLTIRLSIGIFFFVTGFNKLTVDANHKSMLETLTGTGMPFPVVASYLLSGIEMIAGAFLFLGLFKRLSSIVLIVVMIAAILTVNLHSIPSGLSLHTWLSYFFYLPEFLLILLLAYLATSPLRDLELQSLFSRKR